MLASSAVLGLVVGFAARQTLANAIAGIQLAITQPVRVGDLVTFEEETGVVEDMRLSYTVLRLDDGRRLIVPNERLVQSPDLQPHGGRSRACRWRSSVWLPPGGDATRALELLSERDGVDARVAEVTHRRDPHRGDRMGPVARANVVRLPRACVRKACNVSATLLYPPTWPADPVARGRRAPDASGAPSGTSA